MGNSGTTSIAEGIIAVKALISDIEKENLDWNEADTRFQIIDRVIVDCLGWPREEVFLETSRGRQYSDYELGAPRQVIWEAKRKGIIFELPANPQSKKISDLPSILALGGEAEKAIRQAQGYCGTRGIEIGVATNGHQLIAFLASRNDGVAPLEGRCLVIDGFEQLLEQFPNVWQTLSPAGVAERRLRRLLNVGEDKALPAKMSSNLVDYPRYRYPSDLQSSLRMISELLLVDVVDQPDVEKRFFKECYCESGALSQHSLVSKTILAARYSALFDLTEESPDFGPVRNDVGKGVLTPDVLAEAISQRPIVLVGDVGVGKSSFLKHLMHVSAYEEFQDALYVYIDLGSQGALTRDLTSFVLDEIEKQLYDNYNVDVIENKFVQGVYNLDVKRFQNGIYGRLKKTDPREYEDKLLSFLSSKIEQRDQHLKKSITHIALGRKKQIVIIIDNADQRPFDVQQEAFIIAQNFAKDWHAAVFVALRPQTFYRSRQVGAFTAYPQRVFTISPPRVDLVISRRLTFALNMAEGRISVDLLKDVELNLGNISLFLKALIYSLGKNRDLIEFLSNITGGNIRSVVEFVSKFIGSANVDAKKIIEIMEHGSNYLVPTHEFWKSALLGKFSFFDPKTSLALNLFDINNSNSIDHFSLPIILGYLNFDSIHRNKDGFVSTELIIEEMQNWGFSYGVTEFALRRANNKRLVETAQRVTFDEDDSGLYGEMPDTFRISTIGAYHLHRWASEFSYLDAMSYDTPILDRDVRTTIRSKINSFSISDRLDRATAFRNYLTNVWNDSDLQPSYFDWAAVVQAGQSSFDRVSKAISNTHYALKEN